MVPILVLLLSPAHAHPSVDGHLHAVEVRCEQGTDPMEGTVAAIRRAGVLSDAGRTDDALAELDTACLQDAEVVRLARARALVRGERPAQALDVLTGLSGADAAMWRAQALVALGRDDEAGALLAATLQDVPAAPPEAYLQAAELSSPCTALEVLDLGLQRRGDVGSLRRAAAAASWRCTPDSDAGLQRLRPDQVRDLLLAGDLLVDRGRDADARRRWNRAAALLTSQRDTPARRAMQASLTQRLAALDAP